MNRFFWALMILSISSFGAIACGDDDDGGGDAGGDQLNVVTTLPLFADFVRQVGGDRVDVDALLPSGADPHTWEPAPQDIAKIEDADLIVMNGLHLEPSAEQLIEANADAPIVRMAEEAAQAGAAPQAGAEGPEGNPHLWLSVDNAQLYVDAIRDALVSADPEGAPEYDADANAYRAELDDAGAYVKGKVSTVPEARRKLITTHDAFPYLAEYIGFEIIAFVAEGPGQDTSPDAIREILDAVEESGAPAVFSEPQLSGESDTLEQLAGDAGVEVCTLYSDSLDDTVTSYIELMRFDADEIARCLGDDA